MVHEIRKQFVAAFQQPAVAHLQISKTYPYHEALHGESWTLLRDLKKRLDPQRHMNPGALGL